MKNPWPLLLCAALACGDDSGADAGGDADATTMGDAAPPVPAAPLPAAPPSLTPCPPGWSETADIPAACAPWPVSEAPTCVDAEARFPGEASCGRLGTECPSDGWPTGVSDSAIFVLAGAPAGGDGSRAAPLSLLSEAMAVARDGDVVAIAVGEYEEAIDVPGGVTLRGACTEGTTLRSDAARLDHGVVTAAGPNVSVQNLRIGSSEQGGIWVVGADRSVVLEDVLIEDVLVAGIDAEFGASVDGTRVVIRRSRPSVLGVFGRGLTIENGASATMRSLVVEDCVEFGVLSFGADTRVDLEDAAVLRTSALPSGVAGVGLVADVGMIVGTRVVVDRATDAGVAAVEGGSVTLRDSLVRDTRSRPTELDRGRGSYAVDGSRLDFERVSVEDTREAGILAAIDGNVRLRDVIVRRVGPNEADGAFGRGLTVQDFSVLDAARVHIELAHEGGIVIGGVLPAEGAIEDVTIVHTQPDPARGTGRGVTVQKSSRLSASRVRVEHAYEVGIIVGETGVVTLSDVVVRDVRSTASTLSPAGYGFVAQEGSVAAIERAAIEGVSILGVAAFNDGTTVDVRDLSVMNVSSASCGNPACVEGGHAVGVYDSARLNAERFSLDRADLCGVHIADDGLATLTGGAVRGMAIGACVQSRLQPLSDLQGDVFYSDNDTQVQSTTLPVPMANGAL